MSEKIYCRKKCNYLLIMNKSDYQLVADYFCLNKKDDEPVITIEVGNNHNGDIELAKKYIDEAKHCGVDAIKFQTETYDGLWVDKYLDVELNVGVYKGKRRDYHEKTLFYTNDWYDIADYAKKVGITLFSTPTDFESIDLLDELEVPVYKVASMDIINLPLLKYISQKRKPIIISTGASTCEEIDFAVNTIKNKGNENIALLQCTSKYPSPLKSLNISAIPTMKQKYKIPIGFSDHSLHPFIGPLISIGLGATIIEKHFTLDKTLPGPDHSFALDPSELELMINSVRSAEKTFGSGKKEILADEEELHKFATRSIQAISDISRGDVLQEGKNFDILRPGNRIRGIDARFLSKINGKKSTKNIASGDGITDYE